MEKSIKARDKVDFSFFLWYNMREKKKYRKSIMNKNTLNILYAAAGGVTFENKPA